MWPTSPAPAWRNGRGGGSTRRVRVDRQGESLPTSATKVGDGSGSGWAREVIDPEKNDKGPHCSWVTWNDVERKKIGYIFVHIWLWNEWLRYLRWVKCDHFARWGFVLKPHHDRWLIIVLINPHESHESTEDGSTYLCAWPIITLIPQFLVGTKIQKIQQPSW